MSEKHFVVQGATCKCDYGASPDKLKIASNDRDYINDGSGDAKPIASTKDIGQPLEAKTFGRCSKVNSGCSVNITKWDSFYDKITLTNGGKILTEDSKATCAVSGTPCITIISHGQVAQVSSAHFDNVEVSTMAALNPMAAPPDSNLQIPKVKSIEGKAGAAGEAVQSGKKVPELITRVDEDVTFKVKDYFNPSNADKAKVSWKVFKGHGFSDTGTLIFETIGPDFKTNFDAVGTYRVMAYGANGKGDPTCSIDVTVKVNKLKEEFNMDGLLGHFVKEQYRVRRGMNVTVNAVYEIDPPTAEEKQLVSMQVTDAAGNVIATTGAGEDKITFKVDNSATTYTVTARMGEQVVTKEMKSEANGVVAVTNDQNTTVIRPRTSMSFKVSEMTYTTQVEDFEAGQIKWQLNGKLVGTGKTLTLDGNQYFTNPGKYVVEAYVSVADAWNGKKNVPNAHQKDDWQFEVAHNTITDIKEENGNKNWVVGKRYNVVATTKMPYDAAKDGPFTWTPAGGKGDKLSGVYASHKGKVTVTAMLGESKKVLEVNADFAKIDAWYFGDKEGAYKAKAGWNEQLKMIIKSENAANEQVELHILEADKNSEPNYILGPKKGTFGADGVLTIDINTNDLKSKLGELWFEGDYFDVFFVMLPTQSGLQFDATKKVTCKGKEYIFPAKESNMRGAETGKYVYISKKPEVVDVKYFESGGNLAYRVYKYGEKIDIKIQTANLAGKELTVEFWENKNKEKDELIKSKKVKPDNTELVTINLDTNELKSGDKARNDSYRAFYLVIKADDTKSFMYPKDVADENAHKAEQIYFFQHLKLSDAKEDEWNKLADKNAPAVLKNEPAQKATTTTGCPNCNAPVTLAQLQQIFTKANADDLKAIAANYTKYMAELNMNTCWNKAHFFAQVKGESGESLNITEDENFNYWYKRLNRFKAFRTAEGKIKAKELGRQTEANVNGLDEEGEKKVANYAYGPQSAKGIELGNTEEGDGWRFRGMGPLQLTGRSNYTVANAYTSKEGGDIIANSELLRTNAKISLLASMAFWKIYKISHVANKQKDENVISVIVGADQEWSGGKTAYGVKKEAFEKNTSVVFKVNECKYGDVVPEKDCNRYKIDVDNFTVTYEYKNLASKQYRYEVIVNKKSVYTKYINAEEMKSTFRGNKVDIRLLPFPETGPNWGRFGTRDAGGDNYASPEMAAHLLGFFFCLPVKGYTDTLYYNDISANDARNIGHSSHRVGVDADIRYPGSPNTAGQVMWSQAAKSFASTEDFVAKLEFILELASKWSFVNNYTYKAGIKHSSGDYASVHQDHFHIGIKFSE